MNEMKPKQSWIRRSQRVIRMVAELHRLGYQRLRIMPYEYPLAWRVCVAPASVFSKHNGAFIPDELRRNDEDELRELVKFDGFFPTYSAASENEYFDWQDAKGDNARALAERFIERFPGVAERGSGRDWIYAGWLAELVGHLESGDFLPLVTSEYMSTRPYSLTALPIRQYGDASGETHEFRLPPPGELDDDPAPYSGESGPTGLVAAIQLAAGPNYLGSPDVVSALVHKIFEMEVRKRAGEATYKEALAVNQEITSAFTGENSGFTRMPGWHAAASPEGGEAWLGTAVIRYFGLNPDYYQGDGLGGILSEGFAALGLQIGKILDGFDGDDAAQWNPHALSQLNELHHWTVSVLLGTNVVTSPERRLPDFVWQPIESSNPEAAD